MQDQTCVCFINEAEISTHRNARHAHIENRGQAKKRGTGHFLSRFSHDCTCLAIMLHYQPYYINDAYWVSKNLMDKAEIVFFCRFLLKTTKTRQEEWKMANCLSQSSPTLGLIYQSTTFFITQLLLDPPNCILIASVFANVVADLY